MKHYYLFIFFAIVLFFSNYSYGQENLSFTVNDVSFTMIFVEGGTFVMGCTPEQENCYTGERPTHKVVLSDFFLGEFEVTQKLWQAVMGVDIKQQWLAHYDGESIFKVQITIMEDSWWGPVPTVYVRATPEDFSKDISLLLPGVGDNYPMFLINYRDCELFCSRLNLLLADLLPEGYKFVIPTEAQWEYAARGGKMSKGFRFSGSDIVDEVAWYYTNSEKTTHEVGKKFKNELGIYDMSGNVWERCRDRYSESYYFTARLREKP